MRSEKQSEQPNQFQLRHDSVLPTGTITDSVRYPGSLSVVKKETPDYNKADVVGENISREWEYVTVARPVDVHEKVIQVPTRRTNQTFVPNIQVREVIKEIPKDEVVYDEKIIKIPHKKIIDKYVEVPVISGKETKYVPKIDIQERIVKMTKPEIKWVEKIIEIPQIKEVVRYVESDKNVETVIRYVPRKSVQDVNLDAEHSNKKYTEIPQDSKITYKDIVGPKPGQNTPSGFIPLAQLEDQKPSSYSMPATPRLDRIEQLFIPRVEKTIEIEKQIPVTVDVSVPFMVPKPVQIPVEVPVLKFRDHFIPVPVRRHVVPRIIFTNEVFEVECTIEKPVLIVKDHFKPVPVNAKIKLKEKNIKVVPIDPAELSQADFHALWMRVNADLLEKWKEDGHTLQFHTTNDKEYADNEDHILDDELPDLDEDLSEEERAKRIQEHQEAQARRAQQANEFETGRSREDSETSSESIQDPSGPVDFGPLPLHPGHPLMMTFLQNQWIQNPSTLTHNLYTPEFFRLHASSLDSLLHPQPHQVNITHEQSVQLGPLPADILPNPWIAMDMNQQVSPPNYPEDNHIDQRQPKTLATTFYSASPSPAGCNPCLLCTTPAPTRSPE